MTTSHDQPVHTPASRRSARRAAASLIVLTVSGGALAIGSAFSPQAGQSGQGGQPSNNPQNPEPRDPPGRDPQRRSTQPDRPNLPDRPGRANERVGRDGNREEEMTRAGSPFPFLSRDSETRFNNSVRELLRREERLQEQHDELMRRLGEARSLSGERQTAAVLDLMQNMLQQHESLLQYLVESRSLLTGNLRDSRVTDRSGRDRPFGDDDGDDNDREDRLRNQERTRNRDNRGGGGR